ncbi:MAG: 30S ribosomal protein S12 methylthiotransferase RimO [Phycisphaerae bacterium]|nr:30S ribosomal protein S12 methylthiotransferase RimO [Phycisphaerae bacterium]
MPKSVDKRVGFVSLGCVKNLVDSEKMLGQLAEAGCTLTNDATDADVVVVNTCGFLAAARDEATDIIREMVALKGQGRLRRVVVVGCLVQRDGESLLDEVPGIDALVGVHNRDDVTRAVLSDPTKPQGGVDLFLGDYHWFVAQDVGRLRLTPQHYAYLRISEGCDQKCTFCTIPAIRGPMHCKPPGVILDEARELISDGAVEIILIGQDTTSYGVDIDYTPGLAGLLRELNQVEGLGWLRLMYTYPSSLTEAMIDAVAQCDRVVNYLDLPLQHINDRVLKAMHRRVTRAQTEALLRRIRDMIPGVHLRTTMIVGFPGETETEFRELLDFVSGFQFDALGVFPYSLEPDTPAGRMHGQVPEAVKEERVQRLMLTQQEVAFSLADRCVNRRFAVMVDGAQDNGVQPARHKGQAPEVDSLTLLPGCDLPPGAMVEVCCTRRQEYDLIAQPIS